VLMGCVCRVRAGERVAMECAPYGDQPIRLSWLRNGQPVNPSLVKVRATLQEKVGGITVPSRDGTYQTLPGRETLNYSRPGRVW
jgi:hypothetical protein